MRVVVTGGRDYADRHHVFRVLDELGPTELAHGCARGADAFANEWAVLRGVPCHPYPADWATYGRAAGMRRNVDMLEGFNPDIVVAFPGGPGTKGCIREARARRFVVLCTRA